MIQRIQTLYIFGGALSVLIGSVFFPYFECDNPSVNLYIFDQYPGALWLLLFLGFSVLAILKFKNRKKQLYYINGNILGIIFLIVFVYSYYFYLDFFLHLKLYVVNSIFTISLSIGLFSFLLARRAIQKDEDLINSINRIR